MSPPDAPSDRDLMLAVRRGDLPALDALFARHHRRLFGFLARLTGDPDAADDMVQDVFLRLLRFREGFKDDGDFVPWLFRIARNIAADRHRDAQRTVPLTGWETALDDTAPLDNLIDHEEQLRLERALATLTPQQRELLLLRGVEKLSHRELASALNCTEASTRVRLHRALAALKRAWHTTAKASP